jgi:hypothetical protein
MAEFDGNEQQLHEILGHAWTHRQVDPAIIPNVEVSPSELLGALRSPHLLNFVTTSPVVAESPREFDASSLDVASLGPSLAAADEEPEDSGETENAEPDQSVDAEKSKRKGRR